MWRCITIVGSLLVCTGALAEETWFQACGPVYPVRLEGSSCLDGSRDVGFGGKHPTSGVNWCCVAQLKTQDELCEEQVRDFVQAARLGRKNSRYNYAALKDSCSNQLERIAKASGIKLPALRTSRKDGGDQSTQRLKGSAQAPSSRVSIREQEQAELADMIRFAIAVSPVVTKLYPPRVMPIDNGAKPPSSASSHPNVLRDLERRPSDISGTGASRGRIQNNAAHNSPPTLSPIRRDQLRSSGSSTTQSPVNTNSSANIVIPQENARQSLKGVKLEGAPTIVESDLSDIKNKALELIK